MFRYSIEAQPILHFIFPLMKKTIFFLLVLCSISICTIYHVLCHILATPPDVVQYEIEGSIPESISTTAYSDDVKAGISSEERNLTSLLCND